VVRVLNETGIEKDPEPPGHLLICLAWYVLYWWVPYGILE
jgi:hypothetical protein